MRSNGGLINTFDTDPNAIYQILNNIIELIVKTPQYTQVDTLILGAFGCGAFAPQNQYKITYINTIATIFKEVIKNYGGYYKNIIFAIPDDFNYDIFNGVFK